MRRLGQRGDTIVEVLVCIAIVSLILTGAYVTTQRSSVGVRNSQEHAEALKLVEAQLERVRADAAGGAGKVFSATTPFCMIDAGPVTALTGPDAGKCVQDSSGSPTTGQPAYSLAITRSASIGGSLFSIEATWDSVTGHGKAKESMVYRLYE
jgi:prepilin-type N-terminal cleavage/methylation domain-containing protein